MISELQIKNLALIDDLKINFFDGFSVFTGETGAGKSILVGAIGLLLGNRAHVESIRQGADKAMVIGIFDIIEISNDLKLLLDENDIPFEDGQLIVRRTISRTGKNKVLLNQIPVPLSTLKNIGNFLIDLHGQHDHQSLLKHEAPLLLIDSFPDIIPIKEEFKKSYAMFLKAAEDLKNYDNNAKELSIKRDMIEFQYNELSKLNLFPGEEDSLEKEYKLLSTQNERMECVSGILNLLEGTLEIPSLDKNITILKNNLQILSKLDTTATPWLKDIDTVSAYLAELEAYCSKYIANINDDADIQNKLDYINSRLAKIQKLKKKYSTTFDGLIKKTVELKKDLESLENININRELLKKEYDKTKKQCKKNADNLSQKRLSVCKIFDKEITSRLKPLGFSDGELRTVFTKNELSYNGNETLSFNVRTNKGEPFLPIEKSASGGELSRIMLAIKTYLAEKDKIPTLIFDEIDTGIGGVLATKIGESLNELGKIHQVICVSHFHQMAVCANQHYIVQKKVHNNRTITHIKLLDENEKLDEISRMMGSNTTIAKTHAKELLDRNK